MKEEKTFRQGSWTVNCRLTTENVCFFSPEGRSSEIAKYAAAVRTVCEKIARVQSTMYRPEVSRSAQTKKSTQLRIHTHAYLAIKASISARNAAISTRKSASARSWFLHSANLKSLCVWCGLSKSDCARLERCQRSAARIITGISPLADVSRDLLLARAGLCTLEARRNASLAFFVKRLLTDRLPQHLRNVTNAWLSSPPNLAPFRATSEFHSRTSKAGRRNAWGVRRYTCRFVYGTKLWSTFAGPKRNCLLVLS